LLAALTSSKLNDSSKSKLNDSSKSGGGKNSDEKSYKGNGSSMGGGFIIS
jgi:hypothetical protein